MKLTQDWGDGVNKITIEDTEENLRKAIRYITHWTSGDMLLRFNALDTETRDKYIEKIKIFLDGKRKTLV